VQIRHCKYCPIHDRVPQWHVFRVTWSGARITRGMGGFPPTAVISPLHCLCYCHPWGGQFLSLALQVHMYCWQVAQQVTWHTWCWVTFLSASVLMITLVLLLNITFTNRWSLICQFVTYLRPIATQSNAVFTSRRSYASAVLGVVILTICLSVVTRVLCDYRFYFYTAWKGIPSSFLMPKISAIFCQHHPRRGCQIEVW